MDDRSGTERGLSEPIHAFEDDPFAELAKLIEEPWSTPASGSAKQDAALPGGHAVTTDPTSEQSVAATAALSASTRGNADPEVADASGFGQDSDAYDLDKGLHVSAYQDPIAPEAFSDTSFEEEKAEPVRLESPHGGSAKDETLDGAAVEDASFFDELMETCTDRPLSDEFTEVEQPATEPNAQTIAVDENEPLHPASELGSAEQGDRLSEGSNQGTLEAELLSGLDAELASFAAEIDNEPVAPAPSRAVAPEREPMRPLFGAAMFGANSVREPAGGGNARSSDDRLLRPREVGEQAAKSSTEEKCADTEFVMALHGLSAPADPLAGKVGKAEAFAPERKAEEESTAKVFDDFDSLLASEMAVLNSSKPNAASPIHPVSDQNDGAGRVAFHDVDSDPLPRILKTFSEQNHHGDEKARRSSTSARLGLHTRKIAAGLAGIILLGGAGMMVLSSDLGANDAEPPLIVKADAEPVKIVPPNPGGKQVANQNSPTYEKVADAQGVLQPKQEALVSASETPVDLPQEAVDQYENLPGVKTSAFAIAMSDTRPASAEPVLKPRRVKTVTVMPDGTIMGGQSTESIEPTPALIAASAQPIDGLISVGGITSAMAQEATLEGAGNLETIAAMAGTLDNVPASVEDQTSNPPEAEMTVGEPAPNVPVPSMKPGAPERRVASLQSNSGSNGVIDNSTAPRPALNEAASAPVADAWYVQMSSQPSNEAAQVSAKTISSRFSNIVSGRQIVIQTADIAGKGTYHRVRLAASSKQEAVGLCEQVKSAGGSCFVAR